jgi:hypothetical protein
VGGRKRKENKIKMKESSCPPFGFEVVLKTHTYFSP